MEDYTVIILRGVPGSGKSSVAEYLNNIGIKSSISSVIFCADDYFTDIDGNYNFDRDKLHLAHSTCKHKFITSLNVINQIIVANTSTNSSDVSWYRNKATTAGYKVIVLTVENWHNGNDIHNVPEEAKMKMKEQLIKSIKL